MTTPTRSVLVFWLAWVAAAAAGMGLGWLAGWTLSTALALPISDFTSGLVDDLHLQHILRRGANGALIGAAIGLVQGSAQWLVLRRRLPHAGWWVLATLIGWTAGWALAQALGRNIAGSLQQRIGWPGSSAEIAAIAGAVAGTLVGVSQWLALRGRLRRAGWWFAAVVVSSTLIWPLATALLVRPAADERWATLQPALAWGAASLPAGALTATVLLWLIKYTRPPKQRPGSSDGERR